MIVKFFAGGKGASAKSSIDYLLGKNRDREKANLIKGDPDLSVAIAESCNFDHNYTVGCLSFEERDLSEEVKKEIISDFEKTFFAGLDDDQYNITWVEHQDKNRLELNFFIPKVELKTQKQLVPYFYKVDFQLADSFKKVMNHKHNLSSPDDPAKTQLIKNDKKLTGSDREIKEFLMSSIYKSFENGTIEDREGITKYLKDLEIEITRETNKSISIKSPETKKNIRLDGEVFHKDFNFEKTLNKLTDEKKEFENSKSNDYEKALKTLSDFTRKRKDDFLKKYSTAKGLHHNERIRETETDRSKENAITREPRERNAEITRENSARIGEQQKPFFTENRIDNREQNARSDKSDSIANTSVRREIDSTRDIKKTETPTSFSSDFNNDKSMLGGIDKLHDDEREIYENRATEFSRSEDNLSRSSAFQRDEPIENSTKRERTLSITRPEQGRDLRGKNRAFSNVHKELRGFEDVFSRIKELVKQLKESIERSVGRDRKITGDEYSINATEREINGIKSGVDRFASCIRENASRIDETERNIDKSNQYIDAAERKIDATKYDIDATSDRVADVKYFFEKSASKAQPVIEREKKTSSFDFDL